MDDKLQRPPYRTDQKVLSLSLIRGKPFELPATLFFYAFASAAGISSAVVSTTALPSRPTPIISFNSTSSNSSSVGLSDSAKNSALKL
jgi:predicted permease